MTTIRRLLPSGKTVIDTGKVLIGVRAPALGSAMSRDADALQASLLEQVSRRGHDRMTRAARRDYDEAFSGMPPAPERVKLDTGLLAAAGRLVAQLMQRAR